MKNKKKLWAILPIALAMLMLLAIHLLYRCSDDDQAIIDSVLKPHIWQEFSSVIYNFANWSSRVLVNLPIHIMLHFPYGVWIFFDMLMWLIIVVGISYIAFSDDKIRKNIILVSFILLFPINYVTSAGWITTTMTYIWPLAAGIATLTSIKYVNEERELKWYHYVMYILTALYGANQEEMSVFLSVIFVTYLIYEIYAKKISKLHIIQTILVVGNFLFHLLTPGNEIRSEQSIAIFFTDYKSLSLIDKIELGFSSTLYRFIFNKDYIFFFVTLIMCIAVWQKQKNILFRFIGLLPVCIQVFFGYRIGYLMETKKHLQIFCQRLRVRGIITETNFYNWREYIPLAIIIFTGVTMIVCFYLIYGESFKTVLMSAILIGGVAARMILAFSPTVWASSDRTHTIMYFTFIIIGAILVGDMDLRKHKVVGYILPALIAGFGIYNYIYVYGLMS